MGRDGDDANQSLIGIAFGLDSFSLDDRMRLFHYTAAENRTAYAGVASGGGDRYGG